MQKFKEKLGVKHFVGNKIIVTVAFTAMMTALYFVLDRVLVVYPTQSIKLSFNFIPVVIAALYLGPVSAAIVGGLGDLLGAVLMPVGAPNPLLTISAALTGVVYGLFLYQAARGRVWRIITANIIITIVLSLVFNTFALALMYSGGRITEYIAVNLPGRIIKESIMFAVRIAVCAFITVTSNKLNTVLNRELKR